MTLEVAELPTAAKASRLEAAREWLQAHMRARVWGQPDEVQAVLHELVRDKQRKASARMRRYLQQANAAHARNQPHTAKALLMKAQLWSEVLYPWQHMMDKAKAHGWAHLLQWVERYGQH